MRLYIVYEGARVEAISMLHHRCRYLLLRIICSIISRIMMKPEIYLKQVQSTYRKWFLLPLNELVNEGEN